METEEAAVMQRFFAISSKYIQKQHILEDELYCIGGYPLKNAFATAINDIFTFLRIKKGPSPAFQAKIDELFTLAEERN
jgi:hypothetical protein